MRNRVLGVVLLTAILGHAQQDISRVVKVSGKVMAGQLLTKVQPVYPPDAKVKHLQGVVVLHAMIGRDGTIQNLSVISGHESLQKSATDAVSQWVYKPFLLDGEPVPVDTTITVVFQLGTQEITPVTAVGGTLEPTGRPASHEPAAGAMQISPESASSNLVTKVQPMYSPDAKAKGVQGPVVLRLVIANNGTVERVSVVDGPLELRDAAMEAVRQWVYRPYLLNGKAVPVQTVATVNFTLGG